MPAANTNTSSSTFPTIRYTNLDIVPQSSSFNGLVVTHAILLGVVFVFAYPIGMVLLRVQSRFTGFTAHWILQLTGVIAVLLGLASALTFSLQNILYRTLDRTHQVLGIIVIAMTLSIQPVLGYVHHLVYQRVLKRTILSYLHISLGRILIWTGMINTCLYVNISHKLAITPGEDLSH